MSTQIFSIFCIDYRFDALVADFYEGIGKDFSYYANTNAGGALSLGYEKYCKNLCIPCDESNGIHKTNKKACCEPSNPSMKLLKNSIVENLKIALTISTIPEIYLLNHQDCGAIKAYLACSGFPKILGENNLKEIKINSNLLVYAKKYMKKIFSDKKYIMGFVDINGSVATYDSCKKIWTIIYVGQYKDPKGTWYGMSKDSIYKI